MEVGGVGEPGEGGVVESFNVGFEGLHLWWGEGSSGSGVSRELAGERTFSVGLFVFPQIPDTDRC